MPLLAVFAGIKVIVEMKALLVVDIQNDFVPGGALAVHEGDRVVPLINRLQREFELVLATQDWHPASHGSFAANHPGRKIGEQIDLNGLPQVLWPVHCVENTHGADFVAGLDRTFIHRVFRKGTDPGIDSYSGFFDNARRRATGLGDYLKKRDVEQLYIAGLATDYCVRFTALDGARLGFQVYVIEDACRGVNLCPLDVQHAIEEMKAAGVRVIESSEVLERGT